MKRHIVVYERDVVVALDIADSAKEAFGDVIVATTRSLADAVWQLGQEAGQQAIAIVHGTEAELRNTELTAALAHSRNRVIAIHAPFADPPGESWIFLPPPFSNKALGDALHRAAARSDRNGTAAVSPRRGTRGEDQGLP